MVGKVVQIPPHGVEFEGWALDRIADFVQRMRVHLGEDASLPISPEDSRFFDVMEIIDLALGYLHQIVPLFDPLADDQKRVTFKLEDDLSKLHVVMIGTLRASNLYVSRFRVKDLQLAA